MISILMPVYNTRHDFLTEAIESCLNQTMDKYEIVIVDNDSDNLETKKVLQNYLSNEKIKLYKCPRIVGKNNISLALNFGLKKCKYDLVARMDSDDVMLGNRLQLQLEYMQKNAEVDIAGAQMKVFPDGYSTKHPPLITKTLALNSSWFLNHPTIIYKKDKIVELGGYPDTPEYGAEDYGLWMEAVRSNLRITNMPEVVLFYRSHGDNLTRKRERHKSYYESIALEKHKLKVLIENEASTNK